MSQTQKFVSAEPAQLLGELHPLVEQLGSTEGLVTLNAASSSLCIGSVRTPQALERFMTAYRTQLLVPLELPTILSAYRLANDNQVRELIALDRGLVHDARLHEFASASKRVGRSQLKRLRPLRDQRVVQRYLKAVENGESHGWHILVYGLTLSIYSLPLRQGLLNYAQQTLAGFLNAASRPLRLSEARRLEHFDEFCLPLPAAVDGLLGESGPT
jgi:urease accessory protein UreF